MADPKKGTGKKPKGSGRRLYTDENPRDTVRIKFATPADATIKIYLDHSVGIGEHPQHIEEIDKLLQKIVDAQEKLKEIQHFKL